MSMRRDGIALTADSIVVSHGGVVAVSDVSLEVRSGELVALLGRNGAGKTTTLRAVAGLEHVGAGRVLVGEHRVHNRAPHAVAAVGCTLVQDNKRIFRRLPVVTNLRLGAYRVSRQEVEQRVAEQLDRFPVLAAKRDVVAGQLSGGEQQQLAIAQGLMAGPRVLLLDEPSVGLALGTLRRTFDMLAELRDQGLAILLAEQSVDQPLRIADRAYVLDLGRVVLSGTASALRDSVALDDAYLGRGSSH